MTPSACPVDSISQKVAAGRTDVLTGGDVGFPAVRGGGAGGGGEGYGGWGGWGRREKRKRD